MKETTPSIFDQVAEMGHEQVVFNYDEATGLKSIIAIHNTTLGPALGGTRFWEYSNDANALTDVLRLSRGMTFKAAITQGIHLGGGKAVIIGSPYKMKSEALWRRYGKFVNGLGGRYYTAEDVGTTTSDMEYVAKETPYCAGKPAYMNGGGDPSPVTAYGTYLGMKASAQKAYGNDSLTGKRILVQGIGHVGEYLVELLAKENANVFISDINEQRLVEVSEKYGATVVNNNDIYSMEIDIYAPCALGATLNSDTIPQLKCDIIAGAANNQLKDEKIHGLEVKRKGIIYAPDFLINAGGLINCYCEVSGDGYNRDRAFGLTEKIYDRTLEIYKLADEKDLTPQESAITIAMERIHSIANLHSRR